MGRRPNLKSAPRPTDLLGRAVHEIVRDYPEALTVLRRAGVDVAAWGGKLLSDVPGAEVLSEALARSLKWRGDPSIDSSGGVPPGAESGGPAGHAPPGARQRGDGATHG